MPEEIREASHIIAEVVDVKGDSIGDAEVVVTNSMGEFGLGFDDGSGIYTGDATSTDRAEIVVSHERFETQSRIVPPGSGVRHELFILGEPGVLTFFRERVSVPIDADRDLIAVTTTTPARQRTDMIDELDADARSYGLDPEDVPELAQRAGMRMYRAGTDDAGELSEIVARLGENPLVEHVGAVVQTRENGFTHLTRDVVVAFRGLKRDQVAEIAREHGYTLTRELVYAASTYVLRWERPATLDILASIAELASRDDVEWAEPSLVVAPELDAITPADTLWPGLWDRQLIGLPDAWQNLQDAGLDTFGDPDIVLAVWDSGTQSVGGVPTNADFNGTVSNGQPKVLASFDFANMVANNDNPWDPHGSGVAGVSVAMANNPNPFSASGLMGSAPNVQIMTCAGRVPYIDIEVGDQYVWMAGFDPQSPLAGFPAAPPPRGADVITCSLTPGSGAPLSGTARATLDFVTTFGRGGKGTMCFFSTGNANMNNVTSRPYGAYEKCFAIAATSIGNDGLTEIPAPYSGWGQIDFSSPSQDAAPTVHNPPAGYMPWSAAHLGTGNLPSSVTTQTTLAANSAAGANTLTLASVAGFVVSDVIHVGAFGGPGSEPGVVTGVNAPANQLTLQGGLLNAHASGDVVVTGPANHRNNFGGTSSATPLAAGVAALVLSADPTLTYIEAREAMRSTAVKLDLGNATANGQWLDINGNVASVTGLPPIRSGWYGYGRIDAAAAVQEALSFDTARDLVIRDNLADTGTVASAGAFWNSPDIWCRVTDPAADPGALPANYAGAGPHESPIRGQDNWVYARVRNNGTTASLDAWVRLSITHFPGMEFTYPASFQPTNGPGDPLPSPMTPGTYFIGEAKVTGVAAGAEEIVPIEWPAALIPPEDVMTPSGNVHWHPCLLAEITPHDGPPPTGNHVWDDNNLAQKNITIVGTDAGADFAMATVIGNLDNQAECLLLEINRGRLPTRVQLWIDLLDPVLWRHLRKYEFQHHRLRGRIPELPTKDRIQQAEIQRATAPQLSHSSAATSTTQSASVLGSATSALETPWLTSLSWLRPKLVPWKLGQREGRIVAYLRSLPRVRLPICAGPGRLSPVVIGGIVGDDVEQGEYEVVLIQRQRDGEISGSATLSLTVGQD